MKSGSEPVDRKRNNSKKNRKGEYDVGYGPAHTRFKPGESGNPHGRPVGGANAKTTMARVVNEKVSVHEGDKSRKMTKLEAMLQNHP
jgi:hypothetical protein